MGLNAKNAVIPENSRLLFKDKNLLELSEEEWQHVRGNEIAMIFQDPMTSLDPTMKIGQQIAEPLIKHQELSEKDALARALELMKGVGIPNAEEHINDYPHQWSGGMRQRAVIAIALAADPEILIADEPTTALDVTIQAQILNLMKQLQKQSNSSIIFITHDLGVVAGMADRVAVMYAGKIVEYGTAIPGTPPDLLEPPLVMLLHREIRMHLPLIVKKSHLSLKISDTHYAATWLLDERAPKVTPPEQILKRWARWEEIQGQEA
ncbi:hypothetical protein Pfo_030900 [Paulownia fortunei]|nr:hypothetical protein Pfo_030900 [Paulownia fortunei]